MDEGKYHKVLDYSKAALNAWEAAVADWKESWPELEPYYALGYYTLSPAGTTYPIVSIDKSHGNKTATTAVYGYWVPGELDALDEIDLGVVP